MGYGTTTKIPILFVTLHKYLIGIVYIFCLIYCVNLLAWVGFASFLKFSAKRLCTHVSDGDLKCQNEKMRHKKGTKLLFSDILVMTI